jgi:hypothetical protein
VSGDVELDDLEIVEFSPDWTEGYLDLLEKTEFKDPMYPSPSREEMESNLKLQSDSGSNRVFFIVNCERHHTTIVRGLR